MKQLSLKNSAKTAIVDDDKYDLIKNVKWSLSPDGYARGVINKKRTFLHRFLTNCPENLVVDHRDGNPLNNTLDNLRICTMAENARNSKKPTGCTSIYKGVRFDRSRNRRKRWMAAIETGGKGITIGRFYTEKEAAIAYNAKAIELFGAFARINEFDKNGDLVSFINVA